MTKNTETTATKTYRAEMGGIAHEGDLERNTSQLAAYGLDLVKAGMMWDECEAGFMVVRGTREQFDAYLQGADHDVDFSREVA